MLFIRKKKKKKANFGGNPLYQATITKQQLSSKQQDVELRHFSGFG